MNRLSVPSHSSLICILCGPKRTASSGLTAYPSWLQRQFSNPYEEYWKVKIIHYYQRLQNAPLSTGFFFSKRQTNLNFFLFLGGGKGGLHSCMFPKTCYISTLDNICFWLMHMHAIFMSSFRHYVIFTMQ